MVARKFRGADKDRNDRFAKTPPVEAKRMLMSRAVTSGRDGEMKAHLHPVCEEDAYLELPVECRCSPGYCGNLKYWMHGVRQAAAAWEK
eukprot:4268578-Karenia_brevis.AAC.1